MSPPVERPGEHRVEQTGDPAAFLARAGAHLALDPVLGTVVTTTADRALREPDAPAHPRWWASVVDVATDEVVGVAMRTAPFEPYPLYLLPMPYAAARDLARWLVAHEPDARHANGAREAVETVLGALAGVHGGTPRVLEHDRLWEVEQVVPPTGVAGAPRQATTADLDLVTAWCRDFLPAADRQAGRPPRTGEGDHLDRDWAAGRIEQGTMWLWEVEHEGRREVVHLTGHSLPALGVARVGPVYTPEPHRGHGYAAALVAHVSQRLLDAGARACLFTDVDNPVSNGVYERIGYRPRAEMVRMELAGLTTPARA